MLKLNENRVRDLIRSYGASPMRWPQADRQAGQKWLADNAAKAQKLLAGASALDQVLNTMSAPTGDTALLQARILRAAKNMAQDGVIQEGVIQGGASHTIAANDAVLRPRIPNVFSAWKAVAAILVLTTGMGFGIGRIAAADTSYASAEALLSISMQSDYIEADLLGDEV